MLVMLVVIITIVSNSDEFWVMMLILNEPSSCDLNGDGDATLKP